MMIAYHCPTLEHFNFQNKQLAVKHNTKPLSDMLEHGKFVSRWEKYRGDTCISFHPVDGAILFSNSDFYRKSGYQILNFSLPATPADFTITEIRIDNKVIYKEKPFREAQIGDILKSGGAETPITDVGSKGVVVCDCEYLTFKSMEERGFILYPKPHVLSKKDAIKFIEHLGGGKVTIE